jgi:hypothetical protein
VDTESVATRDFLHSTSSILIEKHDTTRQYTHTCPLPYIKSRTISKKHDMVHMRMYTALAARERRRDRSDRPRRDRGPPPGRPRPARSRLGAAARSQRRRSRLREIAPLREVRMPPAKPPHGGGHRRLARRVRSTHASDAASDGAARAGGCRDLPAAVTAVTGRRRPLRPTRSTRCGCTCGGAAAALRPASARRTGRGEPWAMCARGTV